jgi:hypothetical protein
MKTDEKIDLYKLHSADYVAPRKPAIVDMGSATYLGILGRGKPGGPEFQAKLGALYNVAFTIKMASKASGRDYAVCKLEGLWWGDNLKPDFTVEPRGAWNWKLIIRVPEFINKSVLAEAIRKLKAAGKPPEVADVRLESLEEARCVQMLHVGPYESEAKTIEVMKQFAGNQGYKLKGLHHEIYLSDPRRVDAARLRTIIRYPLVKSKGKG